MSAASVLQQKIRQTIPLSDAMEFRIDALGLDSIRVSAPLSPNSNIHGTGFAGSIYSAAILAGWALCTHILGEHQVEAELVVAQADIRYRAPVTGDLQCRASTDENQRAQFLRGVREQGKGLLALDIAVGDGPQAQLRATYCAVARGRTG
ncbi:MAG: thioesterase domain-containing protein [Gammaproteobacteria bacterium]|nr:thioesterase domain-containing protein [Gammaproteobacteria bacterium]MDH3449719.1 thioesterase domain-containing protein [Gammaproteobacteria bacterium]